LGTTTPSGKRVEEKKDGKCQRKKREEGRMLKTKADKKENQKKMRRVRERRWRQKEVKRTLKTKADKKENHKKMEKERRQ
jgi:hypothetical protein